MSDIPKELMKKVMTAKGEKIFLNISIGEKKEPVTFDNRTYTHYVSCAPRKEERKEGVYYGIGDLMESTFKSNIPHRRISTTPHRSMIRISPFNHGTILAQHRQRIEAML